MNLRETSGEKCVNICLITEEKETLRWVIRKRSNEQWRERCGNKHTLPVSTLLMAVLIFIHILHILLRGLFYNLHLKKEEEKL